MARINEQLLKLGNRIIDAVYIASMKTGIGFEAFGTIVKEIEDKALVAIFKEYGTRPYIKSELFNPNRSILDENLETELKEFLDRISTALSDMLHQLNFLRENIVKVKTSKAVINTFFDKYKINLDKITSVILTQQDILLDLLQSNDEIEIIEKLESYLESSE